MTVIVKSFRTNNPTFSDATVYPDPAVVYWITAAGFLLPTSRWGVASATPDTPPTTILDLGTELFVAHNLILEKQAFAAAEVGGTPGLQVGPQASKSVGPGSVSYDTASGIVENAGHWNLTTYGTRFIRLARFRGAGPVQVGIGLAPPFSLGAWAGPWPYPQAGDSGFGG